jgi:hypothetical protein
LTRTPVMHTSRAETGEGVWKDVEPGGGPPGSDDG